MREIGSVLRRDTSKNFFSQKSHTPLMKMKNSGKCWLKCEALNQFLNILKIFDDNVEAQENFTLLCVLVDKTLPPHCQQKWFGDFLCLHNLSRDLARPSWKDLALPAGRQWHQHQSLSYQPGGWDPATSGKKWIMAEPARAGYPQ